MGVAAGGAVDDIESSGSLVAGSYDDVGATVICGTASYSKNLGVYIGRFSTSDGIVTIASVSNGCGSRSSKQVKSTRFTGSNSERNRRSLLRWSGIGDTRRGANIDSESSIIGVCT